MSALEGEVPQMIERIGIDAKSIDDFIKLLNDLKEVNHDE
jgi:hypothetical protein